MTERQFNIPEELVYYQNIKDPDDADLVVFNGEVYYRQMDPELEAIDDVAGRLVRTLVDGYLPAGDHVAAWDGTNDDGTTVPDGNYQIEVLAGDAWIVWLDLDLLESVKGMTVKKTAIRYPLRIVSLSVDPEANPWGLALDGFVSKGPRRLKESERDEDAEYEK